jgi:ankyrin repeat protein
LKTIVNILTGDQGEVKKFILANVDINCRDRNCKSTPLHMAAKGNHIEVVETLHNAAGCGDHPEIVSLLLKAGANRHLKTKSGERALDLAVKNEHPKAEKLLKEPSP